VPEKTSPCHHRRWRWINEQRLCTKTL